MYTNQEWDNYHFMTVIQKRLREFKKYYSNPENIVCMERSRLRKVKRISQTLGYLDNFINSNYVDCREWDAFNYLFGESKIVPISEGRGCFKRINPKIKTSKEIKHELSKKMLNVITQREIDDWNKVWDYLKKYSNRWWD
jgi:trehalose-6-phosphate synthase